MANLENLATFRMANPEQKTQEEWQIWFYRRFPTLPPDRAAILTHAFIDGMLAVRKDAHEVLNGYVPPAFLISANPEQEGLGLASYKNGYVVLSSGALQLYTQHLPHESKLQYFPFRGTNTLVFHGRFDDMYRLFGVEEEDHALYEQRFGDHSSIQDPSSVSLEEYEAQPHEYSALQKKLHIAEQKQMPQNTIDFLRHRVKMVEQYVRSRGTEQS